MALIAMVELEGDKSPGAFWAGTNKDVIENHTSALLDEVMRVYDLFTTMDLRSRTSEELFEMTGIAYKIFIKSELHPKAKAEANRWRLIFSNQIVMNVLERMAFGKSLSLEKDDGACFLYPAKVGLVMAGPDIAYHANDLTNHVRDLLGEGELASTDHSAWDWHVPAWLYEADAEAMCTGCSEEYQTLVRNLAHMVMNKTIVFSDGDIAHQLIPGIQASGSFRTSQANSRMRSCVRYLIDGKQCITMGDDCVEPYEPDLQQRYRELGFELKAYGTGDFWNRFEFCSKHWRVNTLYPTDHSVMKMALNARLHRLPDVLGNLYQEMKSHPEFELYEPLFTLDGEREGLDHE